MPDPVASQLPPEWMEAIELALRRQTKSWPAGTLRTIERALAPLLAEREAETNAARGRAVASREPRRRTAVAERDACAECGAPRGAPAAGPCETCGDPRSRVLRILSDLADEAYADQGVDLGPFAERILKVASSLPVGGDDGRQWPRADDEGNVELPCGMCRGTCVDPRSGFACHWCDGEGSVLAVAPPVSSSAGDEAREALTAARELADLCIGDHDAVGRGHLSYVGEMEEALSSRANVARRLVRLLGDATAASSPSPDGGEREALTDEEVAERAFRSWAAPSAGEGQDAPAREESWRIVNVDGPLSQHRHRPSSQYIAGLDEGMPERAPHRVQRGITEWVDVPAEEGEAR